MSVAPTHPIKAARLRAGFASAPKFALAVGVSRRWMHALESGRATPSDRVLLLIADLTGVDSVHLLDQIAAWTADHAPEEQSA